MSKSLKPHLNEIRGWVRQGRTDAWIAHQLEVTVQEIETFKRESGLAPEAEGAAVATATSEEVDLRAADDAAVAAALEAAAVEVEAEEEEPEAKPKRRAGKKGTFEATFDHGEEGYGLWLDPAVKDDPTYAEHWAGHRPIEAKIEENRIVIKRIEP